MATIVGNRAHETSQTTGTASYVLDGPVSDRLALVTAAGRATGDNVGPWQVEYVAQSGPDYEIGVGTLTAGVPATLSRGTVYDSSNGGMAVSWGTGTRDIFLTVSAQSLNSLLNGTPEATPNTYAVRDVQGRIKVGEPSSADHAARKAETDAASSAAAAAQSTANAAQSAVTALDTAVSTPNGSGKLPVASQAEAEAGAATDKVMTPQRTAQAIAAQVPFLKYYESAEQTITVGGLTTVAHGLSGKPRGVLVTVICKTAEHGYSVGDEVAVADTQFDAATTPDNRQATVGFDTGGNMFVLPQKIAVYPKGGGAAQTITAANWRLILRAWR